MAWDMDEKINFNDLFIFSRQLVGVVLGFYLVLIGAIWHIKIERNLDFLEPFYPKIVTFTGLLIFIGGCIWLTASFNNPDASSKSVGFGSRSRKKLGYYDFLTIDEKKIIDILIEKDEDVFQSDLVNELDFSKSKLSELLTELESRSIVQKVRLGKTNKIRLVQQ